MRPFSILVACIIAVAGATVAVGSAMNGPLAHADSRAASSDPQSETKSYAPGSGTCLGGVPACVVFQIPAGAQLATVTIRDDVSPQVGATVCQNLCVAICTTGALVLQPSGTRLTVTLNPSGYQGTLDCGNVGAATSGTVTAVFGAAPPPPPPPPPTGHWPTTNQTLALAGTAHFAPHVVTAIQGVFQDIYEPSIHISSSGAIYVAGHSIGAFTTRAPAAVSTDGGATWRGLPGIAPVQPLADNVQGGGMPDGDEGIIRTDGSGHAWMLDNGAESLILYEWCDDGATLCGFDPDAWDPAGSASTAAACNAVVLDDRPWLAYGHGKLLLQNNDGGLLQFAIYDPTTAEKSWNTCAVLGAAGTYIPGPGAVRDSDGAFAIPQIATMPGEPQGMTVVTGNVDTGPFAIARSGPVFPAVTGTACGSSSAFGFADFSGDGTLYVAGLEGNTATTSVIDIAASKDLQNYSVLRLDTTGIGQVTFLSIAGSPSSDGAALMFALADANCAHQTFYSGRVTLDASGAPMVSDVSLVGESTSTYGDYALNSVGPDGRAYVVTMDSQTLGHLVAWKQDSGPTS